MIPRSQANAGAHNFFWLNLARRLSSLQTIRMKFALQKSAGKFAAAAGAVLVAAGLQTFGQLSNGAPGGVSAAMVRLFGNHSAFTAQAEVQALDA
jgi:HAMP domain-containing protein